MKSVHYILLIICYFIPLTFVYSAGIKGDAQIQGVFDGSPIIIKTTDRLAGAIDSLTWKGNEFVNSADHGRQIQTAWTVNGYGQCYNPTEAGSHLDGVGPNSSSLLLDLKILQSNSMYTKSNPAYWLSPGVHDAGCTFSLDGTSGPWLGGTAVNKTIVSEWLLEKWVTIGHSGIPNVIKYVSTITVPEYPTVRIDYIILDQPSVHLPGNFSVWKQFDSSSGQLVPPNTFYGISGSPHVLITPDEKFALTVYSPEIVTENLSSLPQYPYLGYMAIFLPQFDLSVNGERIAKTEPFIPGSKHTYISYIVLGSPEQVRHSLLLLYAQNSPSVTSTPPPTSPTSTLVTTSPADINSDGIVNAFDYSYFLTYYHSDDINADMNADGTVNAFDYSLFLGYYRQ